MGKIKLPSFPHTPQPIRDLWEGDSEESPIFRENTRTLNNALALTSQKVSEIRPPGGGYSPSVVIQGKVYSYVDPFCATAGVVPRFAEIWVYDPDHEQESKYSFTKHATSSWNHYKSEKCFFVPLITTTRIVTQ